MSSQSSPCLLSRIALPLATVVVMFASAPMAAPRAEGRPRTLGATGVPRMAYTYAVAVSGDRAVVGAEWQDGFRGVAYVLRRDGSEIAFAIDDWASHP